MGTNADYVTGMQTQIKKWDAEVDALAADGKKASGEMRTAYARRLKELRPEPQRGAERSLDEVRTASEVGRRAIAGRHGSSLEHDAGSAGESRGGPEEMTNDALPGPPPAGQDMTRQPGTTTTGERKMSQAQIDVTKERLYAEFETVVAETEQLLKSLAGAGSDKAGAIKVDIEKASPRLAIAFKIREQSVKQAGCRGTGDRRSCPRQPVAVDRRRLASVAAIAGARGGKRRLRVARPWTFALPVLAARAAWPGRCAPCSRARRVVARPCGLHRRRTARGVREARGSPCGLLWRCLPPPSCTWCLWVLTALVAVVFWDTHRVIALAVMAAFYLAFGAVVLVRLRVAVAASPPPFAASLDELHRDLDQLRSPR